MKNLGILFLLCTIVSLQAMEISNKNVEETFKEIKRFFRGTTINENSFWITPSTGKKKKQIKIYSLFKGKIEINLLKTNHKDIQSINPHLIATTILGRTKYVKIWDLKTLNLKKQITMPTPIESMKVSTDKTILIINARDEYTIYNLQDNITTSI